MMPTLYMGTSMGKESMSFQMEMFTWDHSIMVFLREKES